MYLVMYVASKLKNGTVIYQSLLFFFQTLMSAVCRHTPAGMTVCVWTSREATTVCVRLVRAAVATAQRKRESDATERIGNPALTAVLYAHARYRRITQTHTFLTLGLLFQSRRKVVISPFIFPTPDPQATKVYDNKNRLTYWWIAILRMYQISLTLATYFAEQVLHFTYRYYLLKYTTIYFQYLLVDELLSEMWASKEHSLTNDPKTDKRQKGSIHSLFLLLKLITCHFVICLKETVFIHLILLFYSEYIYISRKPMSMLRLQTLRQHCCIWIRNTQHEQTELTHMKRQRLRNGRGTGRVRWINNEEMNDYIKGNRAKRELGW